MSSHYMALVSGGPCCTHKHRKSRHLGLTNVTPQQMSQMSHRPLMSQLLRHRKPCRPLTLQYAEISSASLSNSFYAVSSHHLSMLDCNIWGGVTSVSPILPLSPWVLRTQNSKSPTVILADPFFHLRMYRDAHINCCPCFCILGDIASVILRAFP